MTPPPANDDDDPVDVPPDQVGQFVRREVLSWLEEAWATDPSAEAAAALYSGAMAAVVEFTWRQLGHLHTPGSFQVALAVGVRAALGDLIARPTTIQ